MISPDDSWSASANLLVVTVVNIVIVAAVVAVHYEFLSRLSSRKSGPRLNPRLGIVIGVCGALTAQCGRGLGVRLRLLPDAPRTGLG